MAGAIPDTILLKYHVGEGFNPPLQLLSMLELIKGGLETRPYGRTRDKTGQGVILAL